MKNYLFILIILFSILSCSKSSDPAPSGTSYISMKINGVEWKSSVGAGAISSDSFSASGALEVTGGKDALVLTLLNSTNVGTAYKFEDTKDRILQFVRQSSKVNYYIGKDQKGSSGILTITKTKIINTLMLANATFSGTAVGSDGSKLVITEGKVVNAGVE